MLEMNQAMKTPAIFLLAALCAAAASGQTAPKASTASHVTSKGSSSTATAKSTAAAPWIKLPPGVPVVAHGPVQTPCSLRYEEIKVGAGAPGEPGKLWHIKYTGWRAADGVKFDSWDEHPQPVLGQDGKPEKDADGKPKMGAPQPAAFPLGQGRLIPGFDYGLAGMKIGGKRRLFIPWQMAYGMRNIPEHPEHPGIPAKSDLIFDVELVDVTDMPHPVMPANHPMPGVPGQPGAGAQPGAGVQPHAATAAPASSAAPAPKPAEPATAQPATAAQPAVPAQTATPAPSTTPAQPE